VDDHHTSNARFLVDAGGGWLLPQDTLSAQQLAQMLQGLDRSELLRRAEAAQQLQKTEATERVVRACEELA
jgi:UDP-N-acetylglucosamine--N-acetylmuramyl-(pentapeptide) pyrophosphoryl-undecaprenol N-acetylglucosamine transferase